jgi:hypothetical protein
VDDQVDLVAQGRLEGVPERLVVVFGPGPARWAVGVQLGAEMGV